MWEEIRKLDLRPGNVFSVARPLVRTVSRAHACARAHTHTLSLARSIDRRARGAYRHADVRSMLTMPLLCAGLDDLTVARGKHDFNRTLLDTLD